MRAPCRNFIKDPDTADAERLKVLTGATRGIVEKLQRYAKPGVTVTFDLASPVAHITVTDDKSGMVVLRVTYHAQTYDEYLGQPQAPHDILMDKDSWLKEWKGFNDQQVVTAIASILQSGGLWMGGFDSHDPMTQSQLTALFHDVTDVVSPEHQRWSGYEKLHLRQRNDQGVSTQQPGQSSGGGAPARDEAWDEVERSIFPVVDEQLSRATLEQSEYEGLISTLENIVPYLPGVNVGHTDRIAERIMTKVNGLTLEGFTLSLAEVKAKLASFLD